MNAVAKIEEARPRSVLVDMAHRYGMEPAAFEATVRATVIPSNCSKEQFAAFLLVAKEYRLNPLTKEIYAFPGKGGGIQPIVSIDGWARIINERPELTGIEFEDHLEDAKLYAITAKIHRSDRTMPVCVTEYMAECKRATDTWKQWPARMLRHKALIQCARYAFGFSGIVDPDEYERIVDVTPGRGERPDIRTRLPGPGHVGGFTASNVDDALAQHDPETGEVIDAEIVEPPAEESTARDEGTAKNGPSDGGEQPTLDLSGNAVDLDDWAASFNRGLASLPTVAEVEAAWKAAKTNGLVLKLKAKSPGMAQALADAVNERIGELKAGAA